MPKPPVKKANKNTSYNREKIISLFLNFFLLFFKVGMACASIPPTTEKLLRRCDTRKKRKKYHEVQKLARSLQLPPQAR